MPSGSDAYIYAGTDGGLADYLVVEARNARKVPSNVSLEVAGKSRYRPATIYVWRVDQISAALVEPLSVAWHAVRACITKNTTSALVMGAGPIGLCIMQSLKAHNVANIIAVDTNTTRQSAATTAGAHHFINPLDGKFEEACVGLCPDSNGPHLAFDTAGKQVTIDQCIAVVCVGGTIMNVAVWGGPATIMPNAFLFKELRYMGTAIYTREDFDGVIESIAAGKFRLRFSQHMDLQYL